MKHLHHILTTPLLFTRRPHKNGTENMENSQLHGTEDIHITTITDMENLFSMSSSATL